MAMIPIQNVYYLLCYAWNQVSEGALVDVGDVKSPELADLFAQVLIRGTRRVLRQGLDRDYVVRREDTSRLRGRVNFNATLKRTLRPKAQAHCHFDELSRDVLHNRILKSTLYRLAAARELDRRNAEALARLARRMRGVETIALSSRAFRRV